MKKYKARMADKMLSRRLLGSGAGFDTRPQVVWKDDNCRTASKERCVYG